MGRLRLTASVVLGVLSVLGMLSVLGVLFGLLACVVSQPRESPENAAPFSEPTSGTVLVEAEAPPLASDAGLALDSGEPDAGRVDSGEPQARVGDFNTHMKTLRKDLGVLRDVRWLEAGESAATALESLAAALAFLPDEAAAQDKVATVLAAAHELRRSDSSSLDSAQLIGRGLDAAYSAVESFVRRCDVPPGRMEPWLESARQAVAAVDKTSLLTFQRAAIQDAFRTTGDALTIAGGVASKCGPALLSEAEG